MQAPDIGLPPVAKVLWYLTLDFPHQPRPRNSHPTLWLHKTGKVIQVQVVRAKVSERIDTKDGVKKVRGEWERPGISAHRKDAVLDACVMDPQEVLRGAEPQVRR